MTAIHQFCSPMPSVESNKHQYWIAVIKDLPVGQLALKGGRLRVEPNIVCDSSQLAKGVACLSFRHYTLPFGSYCPVKLALNTGLGAPVQHSGTNTSFWEAWFWHSIQTDAHLPGTGRF